MWCKRLWLMLMVLLPLNVLAGERIALVLGIQQYQFHTPLPQAAVDVKVMYESLVASGIRVINTEQLVNLDIDHLNYWFSELVRQAKTADEVYIYFAGHGLQHNNAVYLLAANSPNYNGETPQSSLLLDIWLEKLIEANPTAQRIVWLDACRDNPLNHYNYVSPSYFGVSLKHSGNLVIYATAKGSKVKDNNPFAEETAQLLKQFPHTDITVLAKDISTLVKAKTKGEQVVEVTHTLTRPVCPQGCDTIGAKGFRRLKQGCIGSTCIQSDLIMSTLPISQADIYKMLASQLRPMSSKLVNGCWQYNNKRYSFLPNYHWDSYDDNLEQAQCLSVNDAEAYARWYTTRKADNYYYRVPKLEESLYIAAYFKQEGEKERLEQCAQMKDNAPCYSHPPLGVYLVRE